MRRLLVVVVVAVLVTGCGGDDSGYSDEVRERFLDSCVESGADRALCECQLDRLIAEVPFDRFEEVDEEMRDRDSGGTVPDDITEAVEPCSN